MKKAYSKPLVEKIVFDYRNHIVASGGQVDDCYWQNGSSYSTHQAVGCVSKTHQIPGATVPA